MKISSSILDADFGQLNAELKSIKNANRIHIDVMDGNFVPNISFSASILKKVDFQNVPLEIHLMVENPQHYFDIFEEIGATQITFHIENTIGRSVEFLKDLKSRGIKSGICVDGDSEIEILSDEILENADQVLLMSVKAGFGGQKFMTKVYDKIKKLRARGFKKEIEIDGGVNLDNVVDLKKAGADIVVAGSSVLSEKADKRKEIITKFQEI
jgi:ribulose-phosphate 3-epimerase